MDDSLVFSYIVAWPSTGQDSTGKVRQTSPESLGFPGGKEQGEGDQQPDTVTRTLTGLVEARMASLGKLMETTLAY